VSSSSGPLNVSVTALGTVAPGRAILRSGALPGDAVCVTGRLGGSLRGRHLTFVPRIVEAQELAERCEVHAMIDVSDGLSTDALHIAEESSVGLILRADAIPVSDDAVAMDREADPPDCPLRHALDDGEDYELVFCVSKQDAGSVAATGLAGTPVSIIGAVTSEPDRFLVLPDGSREPLRSGGWEHQTA
jgi:thiamine-monophosphate kinase